MSIENLLLKYKLTAEAEGSSAKTFAHVNLSVRLFSDFLGGITDAGQVTADDLRHFIVYLRQRPKWTGKRKQKNEKLSANTINTYVRGIKAFWAWLEREEIIKDNPLQAVRSPKLADRLPKVIPDEQMKAVFEAAAENHRTSAILFILLDSGITLSELAGLDNGDVDTKNGSMKVFREKTRRERYVYISPPTAVAIERYRFIRPEPVTSDRLFLGNEGYPLTGNAIQNILARLGRKAGIKERLSPHKLRHTCATSSLKYGSNLEYIRLLLGHSDIRTTSKFYLHAAGDDVARAHRDFSPVVNLGISKTNDRKVRANKVPKRTGSRQGKGDTVIVIQTQPDPANGIMPVTYDSRQKAPRKKQKS